MNSYVLQKLLYKAIRSCSSDITTTEVTRILQRNYGNIVREIMSLEKQKALEEQRKKLELERLKRLEEERLKKKNESKGYSI